MNPSVARSVCAERLKKAMSSIHPKVKLQGTRPVVRQPRPRVTKSGIPYTTTD